MNNQLVEVTFRNQSVQAVQHNGSVFVAMRPISENIGLEWSGQQKKLARQGGKFSCVHIPTTGSDGKRYKMLCIPLRKLNGWLFSVNPEKVRPEIKDNLIAYQEECFEVLHDHFTKGEAAHPRRQEVPPKSSGEQKPRYFIRMVVVDRLHGRTETFQGDASTVKDIVDGTARLFGMHIKKLIHLPATV